MKLIIALTGLLLVGLLTVSPAGASMHMGAFHSNPGSVGITPPADEADKVPSTLPSSELVPGKVPTASEIIRAAQENASEETAQSTMQSIPQDFNGKVDCSNCRIDGYCRVDGVCPNGAVLPKGFNGTITCGSKTCRIKGTIPVSRV